MSESAGLTCICFHLAAHEGLSRGWENCFTATAALWVPLAGYSPQSTPMSSSIICILAEILRPVNTLINCLVSSGRLGYNRGHPAKGISTTQCNLRTEESKTCSLPAPAKTAAVIACLCPCTSAWARRTLPVLSSFLCELTRSADATSQSTELKNTYAQDRPKRQVLFVYIKRNIQTWHIQQT